MLEYRRSFLFDESTETIWNALTSIDSFAEWATWMRDLRVDGEGMIPGTILSFDVASPLPYRLKLDIEITRVIQADSIYADVRRDLRGRGSVHLRDAGANTQVELSWEVEPASRPLRTLLFVSGPLVRWSQDWAVRAALSGARRKLLEQGKER